MDLDDRVSWRNNPKDRSRKRFRITPREGCQQGPRADGPRTDGPWPTTRPLSRCDHHPMSLGPGDTNGRVSPGPRADVSATGRKRGIKGQPCHRRARSETGQGHREKMTPEDGGAIRRGPVDEGLSTRAIRRGPFKEGHSKRAIRRGPFEEGRSEKAIRRGPFEEDPSRG